MQGKGALWVVIHRVFRLLKACLSANRSPLLFPRCPDATSPSSCRVTPRRLVPPTGWLSTALDRLTAAFPPDYHKQWRREGGQERGGGGGFWRRASDAEGQVAPGRAGDTWTEPYWLINLGLTHAGPRDWSSCEG